MDDALAVAQQRGFIGPAPIAVHRALAEAFLDALDAAAPILDLGSGGGLPGLVLAAALPHVEFVLLDARQARTDFLRRVVTRLGWSDRVEVVQGRAEQLGHEPPRRAAFGAVVARGFGPPAVTAECAAPFLVLHGRLVVSSPPESARERWQADGLATLGLVADARRLRGVERFWQRDLCPPAFARRSLHPALW